MSLTFQNIIVDAKKLVIKISDHESTADTLINKIESLCSQIDSMKQYKEEVEILNTKAKQKPHKQLVTGLQREIKHVQEIQAENKELKQALENYQLALELIMSKYREQTRSLLHLCKTDFASVYNAKYTNIITNQALTINEMVTIMKSAAALDEESELKEKEMYYSLKKENATLREIINIANKYGSLNRDTEVEDKTVQTVTI